MTDNPHPKANAEILHPSRPFVSEIPKLRKIIATKGLSGLANDTKWDELISVMRNAQDQQWCPDFRYRCVDSGWISGWEGEWWHHLPFPFISALWLDLRFIEKISRGRLLSTEIVDHSADVEELLSNIGFDYEMGDDAIRIYGYAPRDRSDFTPRKKAEQGGGGNSAALRASPRANSLKTGHRGDASRGLGSFCVSALALKSDSSILRP